MNIQNITLDISKQPAVASVVAIGQGDTGGTTICAAVYDNGVAADLDGMTAMFEMRLPDGQSYVRDANCTVEGNEITYVVDEEHCASVAGVTDEAYFDIMDGPSVVYSTGRFRVNVLRAAHYDGEPAESWDNAVDSFLANLRDDADEIIGEVGGRQDANDAHQAANDLAQEANNAQQAINNQMASGGVFQVLATGQYDASTLKPTIVGARVGVFYLVPTGASSDPHLEWIYNGSDFELVGTNAGVLDPVSTGDIDSVVADNSPQGNSVLNLSGLTYLWAKLKAAFAALTHAHAASDITSGQLAIANGGTGASTAVGAKAAIVDGQALSPASVTATGAVAGSSVSDSVGSLAALRDSVSRTAVQASNLLTLVSGFSFSSSANNRFIVSANIVAYVLQITTSSALTAGTTCQIGTLASSVASTPQLCILDQSGTVVLNGTSMSFISGSNRAAGTTFWLRGFYMLA